MVIYPTLCTTVRRINSASQSFFPVAVGAIVTMHFMAILGQKLLKESLLFRQDEVRSGSLLQRIFESPRSWRRHKCTKSDYLSVSNSFLVWRTQHTFGESDTPHKTRWTWML